MGRWCREWAALRGLTYWFAQQTTSTNDKARQLYKTCQGPAQACPRLIITTHQSQGRGRRGRVWKNSDMMLSWTFPQSRVPQPVTTELMAQALWEALKSTWKNLNISIHPPNDIYCEEKKMAGLLTEVLSCGDRHLLIVGGGMNVFSHPDSFTHLQAHLKENITRSEWFLFMQEWYKHIQQALKKERMFQKDF